MINIITGDIETNDGLNGCDFALGVLYDGNDYMMFKNVDEFCKYIVNIDGNKHKIYFHNLSFDGRFIQQYLLDNGIKFDTAYRTSSLLKISIRQPRRNLNILDSYALIPLALEKFPLVFGLDTKKQSLDNLELRCTTDCKILYDGLLKFNEILPLSSRCFTIAQTSLKTFNSEIHLNYRFTSDGIIVNKPLETLAKLGYYGGRTEIFNLNYCDNVRVYDINSLYPYVMRNNLYPVDIKEEKPTKAILKEDLYYVNALVSLPYTYIPKLPVKVGGKLLFTYGTFDGWFYSPEFNAIKDIAEYIEIKKAYSFTPSKLFKEFIDKYYGLRLKYKRENNNLEYCFKILLNGLYGKFAQNREKSSIEYTTDIDEGLKEIYDGIYYKEIEHFNTSANINPFISGFITSFSRLEDSKYLDEDTYQTDTDSIFTTKKLTNVGDGLGQLKLEYEGEFKAFCPKTYWLKTTKGIITKAKGVISSEIPKSATPDEFEQMIKNTKWVIYAKSKESIKRFGTFVYPKSVAKELTLNYSKRKILIDLTTKPFNYKEVT